MRRQFAGLELLRFLSAVAVLLWHYQHFFYQCADGTTFVPSAQPLFALLFPLYGYGHFAVQVFWCISGFIFFHRYGAAIHERRVSLREYLVFRVSRLYPLHVATLLAVVALQWAFMRVHGGGVRFVYQALDARHFLLNVLMVPWWGYQDGLSFNGPVWSVSVEEFCYVSFFLLASAVAFHRRSLAALLVAAWVILTARVFQFDFGQCIALFLLGGVLHGVHGWLAARGGWARVAALAGLPLAGALTAAGRASYLRAPPLLQLTVLHFAIVPMILLGFLALWRDERGMGARAAGELGKLTYSIYMVHFPVQLAAVTLVEWLGWKRAVFYSPAALAAFVGVVLALGAVVYRRFEMPMQAWARARLLPRLAEERPAGPASRAA